jgi:hypothetical protein
MKFISFILIFSFSLLSLPSYADGSFRLKSGKLISTGKSKAEVYDLAGSPTQKSREYKALNTRYKDKQTRVEVQTYKLRGSIGGMYIVSVSFHKGKVVSVESKQVGRL